MYFSSLLVIAESVRTEPKIQQQILANNVVLSCVAKDDVWQKMMAKPIYISQCHVSFDLFTLSD